MSQVSTLRLSLQGNGEPDDEYYDEEEEEYWDEEDEEDRPRGDDEDDEFDEPDEDDEVWQVGGAAKGGRLT